MPAGDSSAADGRADGSEPPAGRAKMAWAAALVLASAATVVLVLSDDARLLRLGLVAALWAALIGAFAVARLRNRLVDQDEHAADQQRIYELELEQEVAARREFELEAENEARRRVAEESEDEVQALRAELRTLRESLEQILGGDMLFERVALRAESTRVRSLTEGQGDENRVVAHQNPAPQAAAPQNGARELPAGHGGNANAGPVPPNADESTELITRVPGDDVAAGGWPTSDGSRQPQEPVRAQRAAAGQPPPSVQPGQSAQPPRKAPVSQQKVTASQRKAPVSQQNAPGRAPRAQSAPPVREPASTGTSAPQRPAPAAENPAPRAPASARKNPAVPGNSPVPPTAGPPTAGPQSGTPTGKAAPAASADGPRASAPSRGEFEPVQQDPAQQNPAQQDPAQQNPAQQNPAQQNPAQQNPERPMPGSQPARERSGSRPNTSVPAEQAAPAEQAVPAEQAAPAAPAEQAEASAGGSAEPHPGAHTQGTSVNDLLAVYGGSESSGDAEPRRRRRRD